jgi:hypothetical protein
MTPPIRLGGVVAAAATAATLAFAGTASAAAGSQSFPQTYPIASRLCANVAQGGGPKRLRPAAAQVLAQCNALQSQFNSARAAVLAAETSSAHAISSQRAAIRASCGGRHPHRAACRQLRHNERRTLSGLVAQRIAAVHGYFRTLEAARRNFWTAIHVLRGGRELREDRPIRVQDS